MAEIDNKIKSNYMDKATVGEDFDEAEYEHNFGAKNPTYGGRGRNKPEQVSHATIRKMGGVPELNENTISIVKALGNKVSYEDLKNALDYLTSREQRDGKSLHSARRMYQTMAHPEKINKESYEDMSDDVRELFGLPARSDIKGY